MQRDFEYGPEIYPSEIEKTPYHSNVSQRKTLLPPLNWKQEMKIKPPSFGPPARDIDQDRHFIGRNSLDRFRIQVNSPTTSLQQRDNVRKNAPYLLARNKSSDASHLGVSGSRGGGNKDRHFHGSSSKRRPLAKDSTLLVAQ